MGGATTVGVDVDGGEVCEGRANGGSAMPPLADARFRALVEHAADIVALVEADGTFRYVSPAVRRVLGFAPEEVVGRRVLDLVLAEDRAAVASRLEEVVADAGRPVVVEHRYRHKDGTPRWLESTATNRLADPDVRAIVCNCRDVTARRRAEERLRATEAKLLALFEADVVGIVWGEENLVLEANDAFLAAVGYGRGDLPLDWRAMTPPEQLAESEAAVEASKRLGRFVPFEKEFVRRDGGRVPTILGGSCLSTDPYRYVCFILDVSPQKRAEGERDALLIEARRARAEAEAERQRLHDLLMQAPALVAVLRGREGVCELFSPLFQRLWGRREALGKTMREAWPELAGQGYFELVERVFDGGEAETRTEFRAVADWNNDGTPREAFFNFVYAPYRGGEGWVEGVMIFGYEVTEQVRARREAEAAVRLRDEFLSSASHDLRTPLTALVGRAQLLRRQLGRPGEPDRAKLLEGIEAIQAVSGQMAAQIDELQDVAFVRIGRPLELRVAPIDLAALVWAQVEAMRRQAPRHPIRVGADEAVVAPVDPTRIARVVDNLLANAVKYSPGGGEVAVGVAREDGWARLTVRDWGVGIPAADLPRIFDRFHRGGNVADRFVGSGLGLAGARQIVEQHEGTIEVESAEGVGSTFTVRLPLSPPADEVVPLGR